MSHLEVTSKRTYSKAKETGKYSGVSCGAGEISIAEARRLLSQKLAQYKKLCEEVEKVKAILII